MRAVERERYDFQFLNIWKINIIVNYSSYLETGKFIVNLFVLKNFNNIVYHLRHYEKRVSD